jgi:hypothetical protein
MSVNELIALLQTLPADDHVFLFLNNNRHAIAAVTNDFGDNCVDLIGAQNENI